MLIKDTPQQERAGYLDQISYKDYQDARFVREALDREVFVDKIVGSKGDLEAQLGRSLDANIFEQKLQTILPSNVVIFHNPENSNSRGILQLNPKRLIAAYKGGLMPEFSQMRVVEEDVFVGGDGFKFSAKDMPKMEKVDDPTSPVGYSFAPADGQKALPGWERRKKFWNEETRGWRTVLVMLVIHGIISGETAERVFGRPNTAEWKGHLGHGERTTRW